MPKMHCVRNVVAMSVVLRAKNALLRTSDGAASDLAPDTAERPRGTDACNSDHATGCLAGYG